MKQHLGAASCTEWPLTVERTSSNDVGTSAICNRINTIASSEAQELSHVASFRSTLALHSASCRSATVTVDVQLSSVARSVANLIFDGASFRLVFIGCNYVYPPYVRIAHEAWPAETEPIQYSVAIRRSPTMSRVRHLFVWCRPRWGWGWRSAKHTLHVYDGGWHRVCVRAYVCVCVSEWRPSYLAVNHDDIQHTTSPCRRARHLTSPPSVVTTRPTDRPTDHSMCIPDRYAVRPTRPDPSWPDTTGPAAVYHDWLASGARRGQLVAVVCRTIVAVYSISSVGEKRCRRRDAGEICFASR